MVKLMKPLIAILIATAAGNMPALAQAGVPAVKKGNDAYKKGDYATAEMYYRKALIKEPGSITAKFNLGNAMEKQKKEEQAAAMFNDVAAGKTIDTAMKARAFYNKGLALVRDNKLPMAVDAFKQALRLTPDDEPTRENLQKAMNEMREQQQQQKQQNNQAPPPPPQKKEEKEDNAKSKLNQKQAEQMLGQLRDNEKQLQKQIQKGHNPPAQNKKDW